MNHRRGKPKICSKGHKFYKNSDCPVCPVCWPDQKKKLESDFPKLAAPALRALNGAGINNLTGLTKKTVKEVLELHGMGKSSISKLQEALKAKGLKFKEG